MNSFSSHIDHDSIQVDTIIDAPNVAFGENLSGKIYIEGPDCEHIIKQIELEVVRQSEQETETDTTISRHSFEMVSLIKSKETYMIPFAFIPDERWVSQEPLEELHDSLLLRTTVYFKNGIQQYDEDQISYDSTV